MSISLKNSSQSLLSTQSNYYSNSTKSQRSSDAKLPPVSSSRTTHKQPNRRSVNNGMPSFQTRTNSRTSAHQLRVSHLSTDIVPAQRPSDAGKLTVVLDVDETLIHSRLSGTQESYRQDEERKDSASACDEFKIVLEDGEVVWVNKRPGLDSFLEKVSKQYEILVYTAGLEEYARPLLDRLDPENKYFRARLYRDSCVFAKGYYVKDLSKLNRQLARTVLVDNNAFCFLPQLSNGIPISSFYDDPSDTALEVLTAFLERLADEKDVRPFLRQSFNLSTLLKDHRDQIMG